MLEIRNLSKRYPNGTEALRDVSLSIPVGMFGLLGPNGAGKSTLMRTIATLQEPDSGSITLGDIDVVRQRDALRRVLGYLPQEFGVYPGAPAEELLTHLAALKGVPASDRARTVRALLEQVNLWDVRDKAVASFSGGMRQRFGIAQALLGSPKLIVVDEPTAGLDPAERARFHGILADIAEDVVVILSTHIVSDVADLCPTMAILDKGRVLISGSPAAAVAALEGRVYRREVARGEVDAVRTERRVISTRLVAGRTVLHVLADAPPGDGFEPVTPDLEDVYFATLAAPPAGTA